jgi:hypothetical protein
MQAFMSPDTVVRLFLEFYRARKRIEDKKCNRLYERQLTHFIVVNGDVITDMTDPQATELDFAASVK